MPTLEWMREEFDYGYDSGDILADPPDERRAFEEARIGGSYRRVFLEAVTPNIPPGALTLELGPGRGSWTRALLSAPDRRVVTVDFQDAGRWTDPVVYGGRLTHIRVCDNEFNELPDGAFDFFFSWGVLCHWGKPQLEHMLTRLLPKMKPGGKAFANYAAWEKLDRFGWERGSVPPAFRDASDDEIWWPRNTVEEMAAICRRAGWRVLSADLEVVERDGTFLLEAP